MTAFAPDLLALAGAAGAVGLGGHMLRSAYRFEVRRLQLTLPGLRRPLRLAQLSDLHIGPYMRRAQLRGWLDATAALQPDLIAFTGDLVDRWFRGDPAALGAELARLRAPLGTAAVWGNHDHHAFPDPAPLADALAGAGVRLLDNRWERLRDDLVLAGVDDLRQGRPDLDAALRGRPPGAATVLLCHNPDLLPEVPATVALTLAGHTHGGQVRLPLLGALLTSSHYGQRFAEGWVAGPALGFVSRGLGVSGLPIRLRCAPEVVLFDLRPPAPHGVGDEAAMSGE